MQTALHHASCVAYSESGVLILGASGTGKSALALQLMAYGAILVADDQTCLRRTPDGIIASAPATLRGLIEARGVGVLNADPLAEMPVSLVVDMDVKETERIPPRREVTLLGQHLPLLRHIDGIHLAPAILQWMRAGRSER